MLECDYYINPTVLSQCIRMDDYAAASRRLAKHPEEASVWVCRRVHLPPQSCHQQSPAKVAIYQPTAERQVITTSRTLPIHIVLSKQPLPQQHKDRNELLAGLITTYPECCQRRAPNGKYILETLIAERATTQIISLALAACPVAIHKISIPADTPGRIRQLLLRGQPFWEKVRAYAHMKTHTDLNDNRSVATKTHISLKSNGIQDLKTLEQRCLSLERLLLTANAENYELQQEIMRKDQIIREMKEVIMEESWRAVQHPQRPVHEEPQLADSVPILQAPAPRPYSTYTIVSSLSVDQSRQVCSIMAHDDDNPSHNDSEDDDEDTTALMDAICRPMSPLDELEKDVDRPRGDFGGLPWIPNLDETVASADDDEITMDTILKEAELWNGRKLSPAVVRAWNQIPAVRTDAKPDCVIRSPHSVA